MLRRFRLNAFVLLCILKAKLVPKDDDVVRSDRATEGSIVLIKLNLQDDSDNYCLIIYFKYVPLLNQCNIIPLTLLSTRAGKFRIRVASVSSTVQRPLLTAGLASNKWSRFQEWSLPGTKTQRAPESRAQCEFIKRPS